MLKQYDLALTMLNKSLEIDPDLAETYLLKGKIYYKKKDYEKAVEEFTKAIEKDPKYEKAYDERAWVFEKLEDLELALADYTQAIIINPVNSSYYYSRARLFHETRNFDAAIEDCTKALIIKPDDVFSFILRGRSYFSLKEYDHAFIDLKEAVKLNPVYKKLYLDIEADYHIMNKDYDLAIENYTKIISIDEDWYALIYKKRGMCYELQELNYLALQDYRTFVSKAGEGFKDEVEDAKERIERLSEK